MPVKILCRFITLILAIAAIGFSTARPVHAQSCGFAISNVNFGTVDTSTGSNFDTTATLQIFCIGAPGATVRICPSIGAGSGGVAAGGDPRHMLSGSDQLDYNLYQNAARTVVWGSYFWGEPPTPPTFDVTLSGGFFGFAFTNRTIYARIPGGQTGAAAGSFTSAYTGAQARVAYAYTSAGSCAAIGNTNASPEAFNVTAVNVPTCTVSATNLDFGSTGMLTSNIDASNTLSVNCTPGTSYTVGLDGGLSGATDPTQRKMTLGADEITYGLYQNAARTLPWGDTVGTTVAGTGTGTAQSLQVYGRVPSQLTPPAGVYTDTIVVTLTY